MLKFLDQANGKKHFELTAQLDYHVGYDGSGDVVAVPAGFQTDFASVPSIFWPILSPVGRYSKAAVVHDFLCEQCEKHHYRSDVPGLKSRRDADQIFLEAMTILAVKPWKRYVMFSAVRLWGIVSEFRAKRRVTQPTSHTCSSL